MTGAAIGGPFLLRWRKGANLSKSRKIIENRGALYFVITLFNQVITNVGLSVPHSLFS
jgi:hypothetical protein